MLVAEGVEPVLCLLEGISRVSLVFSAEEQKGSVLRGFRDGCGVVRLRSHIWESIHKWIRSRKGIGSYLSRCVR
jgi:hypothetical protein